MLEPFYEDIYLAIRKVGLLRVIPDAYYPKSIVRESFRESQLNKYIKERTHGKKIRDFERTIMIFGFTHQYADWEASVKVLNHGQLVAIKFYNNREVWGQSITKFITRNTNTSDRKKCGLNSIGVPVTLFKDGAIERRLSIIDMPSNYLYCKRFLLSDELIYFTESIGAKIVNYVDNAPFVGTTFKKNITEQEKLLVVNMVLDYTIVTDQQLYRLNRWEKSLSTQSEELRAQDLVKIKSLLIQCLNTIGFVKTTTEEEYYIDSESYLREMYAKNYPDSLYILDRLNSGLESLTKQCIKGLYGNNYNPTYFMQMNKLSEKQQQAEQFYIKAYLLMAKNELLRSTPSAFYPLSLVKEQAKESGFDEFLLKKEMEEKKEKMDYQKLLIEFYGSYKLWTIAVSDFISEQK